MPTYWKKYTSRNKENGQMIKKTYTWKQKRMLWFIRGKECIFGSALPNGLYWTLSATKTNTVVAKIKYNFGLPLFQMFQLLYIEESAMGHLKQGVLF